MKNILIIGDSILAKNFLEKIIKLKNLRHNYTIVYNSDNTISENIKGDNITLIKFDPTSLARLKLIFRSSFDMIMIVDGEEYIARHIYKNIQDISPNSEIYMLDSWGISRVFKDEKHLKTVDIVDIITSRMIGYLPDHPVLADDIGLGSGEIMEAKVPIGSSFAYKRVGMFINQKYKIPMIYRHNEAIVTKFTTMILPNDTLLLVGEPNVLRDVFTTIKTAKGQFPSPFGINFYLIIDMSKTSKDERLNMIKTAKYLNSKVANIKLFIRIINPTNLDTIRELEGLSGEDNTEVMVEYNKRAEIMSSDITNHKIGMIMSNNSFFERHKKALYKLKVPVLTFGNHNIEDLDKGVVLLNSKSTTVGASTMFDLCSQLGLNVYLYYYDQVQKDEVISYYRDLADLFKKDLLIKKDSDINPLATLYKKSKFLQFLPFNDKILKPNLISNLSKDMDELYFKLESNYQLFIPDFSEI